MSSPLRAKRASVDVHESPRMHPQFAEQNARMRQNRMHASPSIHRKDKEDNPESKQTDNISAAISPRRPPSRPSTPSSSLISKSSLAHPLKKVLPRNYFECEFPDLLNLISSMLSELIKLNDSLPLVQSQLTRFHSRAPPAISHRDYLHRLIRFCSLEKSTLLSMVFYIDLLCAAFSSFTISSLTVHRFLITAATVASKGLCDSFCTNTHYAKVGGVSLAELNLLEVEFLVRVGWRVVPAVKTLDEYYMRMAARMSEVYVLEEEHAQSDSAEH